MAATDGTRAVEPRSLFAGVDDAAWFEALAGSIDAPAEKAAPLPGFPPPEFQVATVGSSGRQALHEAFHFWTLLRRYATANGLKLEPDGRVLDFGCGWGRMVRFWLRDLDGEGIWGADVGVDMISQCREHFRQGRFVLVPAAPPSELPRAYFDLVYAYSVFSHLNESVSLAWVQELAAVLKPGGLLVVTTQGRGFIDRCEQVRQGAAPANAWEASLASLFVDRDGALAAYDRGEFLHAPTGGGDDRPATFYGETLIPPLYIGRVWARHLELVEFHDDPSVLGQALVVLRKP